MNSFKYAVRETVGKLGDYIPNPPHKRLRDVIVKYGLEWLLFPINEKQESKIKTHVMYRVQEVEISK